MSVAAETDIIRHMLSEGRLTRPDDAGHVMELWANCPDDDAIAPVHRVVRTGSRIDSLVMRCPSCGEDFTTTAEALHLR